MIGRLSPCLVLATMLVFMPALPAGIASAQAEAAKFRWRWEKIPGPGEHPWTTRWRSDQSGPFCEHTGEGKFCGCSNTSACGQFNNGQEIATAPYGCDRPERWRLRCITEPQ
jgi:hypothetical protein